jgi:methyltransferase-like protein/2-polyprenyl-3-methyl-5-hydroxy-6-metoxy-1,4-benzoquinol methylase
MVAGKLLQSYDEVPYPELCYTQTHPDRLATLGTLLGLSPAPVSRCRVLELGCAGGGNLIPMAYGLPGSQFTGVDFSATQIDAGNKLIADLRLHNIDLKQRDILDLEPDFGEFDYIIAHGVYSWVPQPVRDRLMAICKSSLAPQGIAYISYNTYPGWHMLGALREMMLYHGRKTDDPEERVERARETVDFLAEFVPGREDPYGTFLKAYGQMIDAYSGFVSQERESDQSGYELLLHDELEAVNDPCYFHEFATHAAEYGLQYLVESDFARVVPTNFPPQVSQALFKMSADIVEVEQYMDFLRNRTLRQTLLCHDDVEVQRNLRPGPSWLSTFYVGTYARPASSDFAVGDSSVARFRGPDGALLSVDHPVSKAALLHLAAVSPQAVPLHALLQGARRQVKEDPAWHGGDDDFERDAQALLANVLQAYSYSARLVELHIRAIDFVLEAGEKPVASQLARLSVRNGAHKVANLRHERVKLDHLGRLLLPFLDGEHDRSSLLEILVAQAASGQINLEQEGRPVVDEADRRAILAQELDLNLRWLGRAALLES